MTRVRGHPDGQAPLCPSYGLELVQRYLVVPEKMSCWVRRALRVFGWATGWKRAL